MNNTINTESMVHHSTVLNQEFGIPYDDAWTYIEEQAKKYDLDLSYNTNVIWCFLEAEKELTKTEGPAWSWKYR